VDLQRFRTGPRHASSRPSVAVVGYISPVKRTAMALEVALRVVERVPDFRLLIAGNAQYTPEDFALEQALRSRVRDDPRLSRCVEFCGHVRDVPTLLSSVTALLHCCPVETFGMALVEAMAAGVPVIAPEAGGPLDIVEPGMTGLFYAAGDVDDAATQLVRVLTDPELAHALGDRGRARAERMFSATAYVARFSAALEGLGG
jgi:glycosyltransferase involved in cell wall biosynthesis